MRSSAYLELVSTLVRKCALVHVCRQALEQTDWHVSVRERHGLADESAGQVRAHLVRTLQVACVSKPSRLIKTSERRTQCSRPKLQSLPIMSSRSRDEISPDEANERQSRSQRQEGK